MAAHNRILRISVDLGSLTTRILGAPAEATTPRVLPTVFARGNSPNSFLIGNKLLKRRNDVDPIWPLQNGVIKSEEQCLTFLRLLRRSVAQKNEEVWAVLSAPSSGRKGEPQKLAELAGIAFDRALVIPGLTLAALAVKNAGLLQSEGAAIADLGAASLQAALMDLARPEPRTIYHLAAGGAMFDLHLLRALNTLFPELSVDVPNARQLKEQYASCGDGPSVCLVQVVHQGRRRIVDIGPTIFEAIAPMGEAVADAALHLLGDPRGRNALTYGREIVLTGGGAKTPGISTTLLSILRSKGYPTERVIVPPAPDEFAVRGGWYVAKLVTAANWEVLA